MPKLWIYGGASNPHDTAVATDAGWDVVGYIDDSPPADTVNGRPVVLPLDFTALDLPVANTVCGSTVARDDVYRTMLDLGMWGTDLIHPSAITHGYQIGGHVCGYIQEFVTIQAGCMVDSNVSIHANTVVGHETKIGEGVFIAHGVMISGRCTIGAGAYIGAGAVLLPGVKIGAFATVGAGAVVTKDVAPAATVKGNPAK